jgi:hypothetical protein
LNAAIVVINIVAFNGGGSIIAITIPVAVAVSTIAIITIVDVALSMLLCHCCHCHAPWQLIRGAGPNHTTETSPMAADGTPTLGLAAQGLAALT